MCCFRWCGRQLCLHNMPISGVNSTPRPTAVYASDPALPRRPQDSLPSCLLIDAQLGWAVRVGVHVGPVVAGIVGQERYQFDIWGDTVNIAARMAGKAMPGSVAVTHDTWARIKDRFEGESLGELEIKGKGTIPVVAVRREKPRL